MSAADEILFAPLAGSDAPWRQLCRSIIEDFEEVRRQQIKPRPPGALLLEHLMEAYHLHTQTRFYIVSSGDGLMEWEFNGQVFLLSDCIILNYEDSGEDAEDLNLYPNTDNDSYVFADHGLAVSYARKVCG